MIETHKLLGNHASHADSNNVQLALGGPAHVVNDLDHVLGHVGRRVPACGLVRVAHAAVVDDKGRVVVGLCVGKILGLALPGGFHTSQSH